MKLLTAAEELFGERSYHRTTVADICARAGMATGSFYSYFGSKAEIFAAVVRAINTDLRQAMKAALEHTEGGQRARERASFRAYFDLLSQRPWIDRIVRESEFIDPGLFREYYERSPIPASATSSACAGPTGRPAAGSPRTFSTTSSSSWPAGWPRATRLGIPVSPDPVNPPVWTTLWKSC
jgi:AcrR family transcriptional regulator